MSMEDILKGILGGAQAQGRSQQSKPDPLADLLGGILGGMAPQPGGARKAGAGSLPDLLGGILGGADGQVDAGDIADILGGILGGGTAAPQPAQPRSGGLGDILGGILGGGTAAPQPAQPRSGGLGDILGGILGAGGASLGGNSFLAPIIQELAERLGLSPAIASAIVGFVLTKLLPGLAAGRATRTQPSQPSIMPGSQAEGLDLDHLLQSMGGGQQPEASYFRRSGIADQLAQQTGLDQDTAAEGLQQVFELLGSQLAAGHTQPRAASPSDLDHLLDTWED